jgi:hypothetical protein
MARLGSSLGIALLLGGIGFAPVEFPEAQAVN